MLDKKRGLNLTNKRVFDRINKFKKRSVQMNLFMVFIKYVGIFVLLALPLFFLFNYFNNEFVKKILDVKREERVFTQAEDLESAGVNLGALESEPSTKEELLVSKQMSILKKMIPLENDFFKVKYSYKEIAFLVMLKDPVKENEGKFYQWLWENSLDLIPKDKFKFVDVE